jgi:hypothetical protein
MRGTLSVAQLLATLALATASWSTERLVKAHATPPASYRSLLAYL